MRPSARFLPVVLFLSALLHGAESPDFAAVRAADDERVAATCAADRARLLAVYSDALHYAHSNGRIDTKASQIEGIVNGPNTCLSIDYRERTFLPAGPGVVLMKGRMLMHLRAKATGAKLVNDLNFLAVWREENGRWRFLAWQSCKNPPADSAAK